MRLVRKKSWKESYSQYLQKQSKTKLINKTTKKKTRNKFNQGSEGPLLQRKLQNFDGRNIEEGTHTHRNTCAHTHTCMHKRTPMFMDYCNN
jgi:hypothetical protein